MKTSHALILLAGMFFGFAVGGIAAQRYEFLLAFLFSIICFLGSYGQATINKD